MYTEPRLVIRLSDFRLIKVGLLRDLPVEKNFKPKEPAASWVCKGGLQGGITRVGRNDLELFVEHFILYAKLT